MQSRLLCLILIWCVLSGQFLTHAQPEKMSFVAEVSRLMDIIINSLYTQKQIFLRELISNASDALDKIRFLAITDSDMLGTQTQLEIKIAYDEDRKTLEIWDNGVGMTKNELITNLGTVAKSGTTNFLESLNAGDINLIGQFGVGFYSSFLVASRVQVISKSNNDKQHKWVSSASNSFTVEEDQGNQIKRGTIVRLFLKEDAVEFCDFEQLQKLIKRYSSFINYPIYLLKRVEIEDKVEKTKAEIDAEIQKTTEQWKNEGREIDEEEIENSINRTITKKIKTTKFERMNQNKPLWTRNKAEIKKSEYRQFYKAVFQDTKNPLTWSHFKAEGEVDFNGLLYVPERAPFDQFDKFYEKKSEVKLYVRRVLVNDQFEDLLPKYLNFIKAIVDSDSVPLNVGRQNLQQDKTLKAIGFKLIKKAVEMLVAFNPTPEDQEELFSEQQEDEKDEQFTSAYERKVEIFDKFWKNFGKNIKLGMVEDSQNRDKLAVLTRWYTTHNVSKLSSLDDIIGRFKQGQKTIYFLGGEDRQTLQYSPLIERLVKEGYEVILGDDPLDESIFSQFKLYKQNKIVNVARADFKEPYKTDEMRKEVKYLKKMYQPLIDYALKELNDSIKDVKISLRLVDSPVTIVADTMNDTPNRERLDTATSMKPQTHYHKQKNILQINPHAPVIQQLNKIVEDEPDENSARLIKNLYYAALIHSGFVVKDPLYFSQSVFSLINTALEIKEEIEQIQISNEDLENLELSPEPPKDQEEEDYNNVHADESQDLEDLVASQNVEVQNLDDLPDGQATGVQVVSEPAEIQDINESVEEKDVTEGAETREDKDLKAAQEILEIKEVEKDKVVQETGQSKVVYEQNKPTDSKETTKPKNSQKTKDQDQEDQNIDDLLADLGDTDDLQDMDLQNFNSDEYLKKLQQLQKSLNKLKGMKLTKGMEDLEDLPNFKDMNYNQKLEQLRKNLQNITPRSAEIPEPEPEPDMESMEL